MESQAAKTTSKSNDFLQKPKQEPNPTFCVDDLIAQHAAIVFRTTSNDIGEKA